MTHYLNEYYDLDTDTLNVGSSAWTGGSKVLARGQLNPFTAVYMAILCFVVLMATVVIAPTETPLISAAALFLSAAYSVPPFKLSRRGLGELTVTLVLNVFTPLYGFAMQYGLTNPNKTMELFYALIPLTFIQFSRMMVMNMPDIDCDKQVGKMTLVAKLGLKNSVKVHLFLLSMGYISSLSWIFVPQIPQTSKILFGCTFPFAIWNALSIMKNWNDKIKFQDIPFWVSTHSAMSALSILVGYAIESNQLLNVVTHVKIFGVYLYLTLLAVFLLSAKYRYYSLWLAKFFFSKEQKQH